MNLYQRIWDDCGYGRRWQKVMATKAHHGRKLSALARIWARMTK